MKNNITTLNEYDGTALLKQGGIPVIESILVNNDQDAQAAAAKLGFPVALKICSEAVPHKTDRGGVALNIKDMSTVSRAVREMSRKFSDVPHAFLVQKMARPGTELILGARRDCVFGPVVLAGIGGIFTEIFRDTAIDLAPVNSTIACAMLRRLRGAALFDGYRSGEALDIAAIANAISALSELISDRPDILEIDVNPFIAYPDGAVAVDALVRLDNSHARSARKRPDPATVAPFFSPASIAVIGASRSAGKGGNIILRNLQRAGFKGAHSSHQPNGQRNSRHALLPQSVRCADAGGIGHDCDS